MKKNKLYYWLVGCLLLSLAACSEGEDGDVYATGLDLNYYVVSPDYDNEVDSLRYAIYEKYGIATYCNDTIGIYDRGEYDRNGNLHPYYKVLRPAYTITGFDEGLSITEAEDDERLCSMLEVMLHNTFDDFPKILLPKCFYVVEEFSGTSNSVSDAYYKGMDCALVSLVEFSGTPEEIGMSLQASIATEALLDKASLELTPFYNVSLALYDGIYGTFVGNLGPEDDPWWPGVGIYDPEEDEPMDLGFLEFAADVFGDEVTPETSGDLLAYVNLFFHKTHEEVIEEYGDYPLVMEKYDIVAAILADIASMPVLD